MNTIEQLPSYIHCKHCKNRHYLTLNKDVYGKWCIGYVDMVTNNAPKGLGLNGSDSIEEAAVRLLAALGRYQRSQGL